MLRDSIEDPADSKISPAHFWENRNFNGVADELAKQKVNHFEDGPIVKNEGHSECNDDSLTKIRPNFSHELSKDSETWPQQNIEEDKTAVERNLVSHDIIVFAETWLHENIQDEALGLSQYDIYRKDRPILTSQKYIGGGVLIALKNYSSNVIAINKDNVEQIFVNISAYGDELIIGGIYLPPSSRHDLYEDHCATVDSVMERFPEKKLLLYGDYNLPNDELGVSAIYNNNNAVQILIESLAFHNLFQSNSIKNCFGVTLDLIFTNDKDIITVEIANDCLLPFDPYHPATVSSITSNTSFKDLKF
ncbi:hypothetical protein JTB14_015590 [Gonioctena quinquepunctata]|nr:hypothetical protein JTB14_015590 [Gonioctena quinquepunctata]